jgi:hypothetical protein
MSIEFWGGVVLGTLFGGCAGYWTAYILFYAKNGNDCDIR